MNAPDIHLLLGLAGLVAPACTVAPSESLPEEPALDDSPADEPRCTSMGEPGVGYFDPELLSSPPVITFQDAELGVWVDALDPATGLFSAVDGRKSLVASDAASLLLTANGPELGQDVSGPAVFFSKSVDDVLQVWRGVIPETLDPIVAAPLTAASTNRFSPLPSQDPAASSNLVLFLRGRYGDADLGFLDAAAPDEEGSPGDVTLGVSGPRWIRGSRAFVFATADGAIARYDTANDSISLLTTDTGSGVLTDGFVVEAPETGGLVLIAIEDQARIAVYVEEDDGFVRRGTIPGPDAAFPYIYSAEPVVVGSKTYVTFHAQEEEVTPPTPTSSSVWLAEVPTASESVVAVRVDDGEIAHRIDPETLVGTNELFVYFNVIPEGRNPWEFVRCRTGIEVQ